MSEGKRAGYVLFEEMKVAIAVTPQWQDKPELQKAISGISNIFKKAGRITTDDEAKLNEYLGVVETELPQFYQAILATKDNFVKADKKESANMVWALLILVAGLGIAISAIIQRSKPEAAGHLPQKDPAVFAPARP